jgi:hypothetical protein
VYLKHTSSRIPRREASTEHERGDSADGCMKKDSQSDRACYSGMQDNTASSQTLEKWSALRELVDG